MFNLPVDLISAAPSVMLSDDLPSAMTTTAPGTRGRRPAEEERRNCLVNDNASPAGQEGHIHNRTWDNTFIVHYTVYLEDI